ncbi:TetR family transcriptional regulator [Stella humosa]|uniref:TetR family transcriptional regulator n=1 Tax=Stella humosa TaxID=94 RepID=A0A3N1L1J5_9PROT|nr:TetR family transcriptional regulator [Stella humosa]ROP84458.1 TetR family transcriptional regulator [Stella humosa]BBK33976.1 hypothetical protein STHU_46100 [Stella humosa]
MAKGARRPAAAADVELAIIEAAMRLAVEKGWRRVALADIALAADRPLADLYDRFPSKSAILGAVSRHADLAVVRGGDPAEDAGERPRDRLFDVVMRRLEYLRPWRAGLAAIARDLRGDPLAGIAALPNFRRSLGWMLEAAGQDTAGLRGAVRLKAFGAIYLATVSTWMGDESPDLTATMARLDRALRRVDGWTSLFGGDSPQAPADAAAQ